MKAPKVRLCIRVRRPDGRHAYVDLVWNRNQTLRSGYALIDGKPECHREGIYYLRFLRDGKRVWRAIGPEADAAVAALEFELQSICLGRSTSDSVSYLTPAPIQLPTPAAQI